MIVIVDYGMGNLGSILNMLKHIGHRDAVISGDHGAIEGASKLILPGVGAFDNGMENLQKKGIIPLLNRKVIEEKVPVLGICLGMQLLARQSEEGRLPGLGWIAGDVKKFRFVGSNTGLKIPHMGWNTVKPDSRSKLFAGMDGEARFYFVHSYHIVCDNPADEAAITGYGYDFCPAVEHENIMGTQFHPEKSHKFGMKLFSNFVGGRVEVRSIPAHG